ncbi:MAG: divalent-cation tolerance protein CutA [Sphingomonas sp.]|nr:divalent-cation tolerance protein CutA [Sphingomonas sp.]
MAVVTIYVVFANIMESRRIGRVVVEERLAACVNTLGAVRSIYRWQGKVEQKFEAAALFKTTAAAADRLIARIAELHSYDVPCIEAWPVEPVLRGYAHWVEDSVAG